MKLSIVFMLIVGNVINAIMEGVEAIEEKLYKRKHNKRKWNHGSWIIKNEG